MDGSHFADQGFVLVANRSSKELSVTYNGRSVGIPPRPHPGRWMTPAAAQKAIEQNRVMGTEDPMNTGSFDTLVYVVGSDMATDPIEQSDKAEALDRSLMDPARQNVQVTLRNKNRVRQDAGLSQRQPTLGAHFTGSAVAD
jgi:hypothetical protein